MLSELLEPRVLYVILASDNHTHERDLSMQRKTWLQSIPKKSQFVILRGHEKSEFRFDGETLYVPIPESYENILAKTIMGFNWILENINFDLLVRTNVSTYYDVSRIGKILHRLQLDSLEFGGFVEFSNFGLKSTSEVEKFITGTGIYLTKPSVLKLANLDVTEFRGVPEDLSISRYLIENHAKMISFPRVNLHSTHILLPGFQTRLKSSEISELASVRFQSLFNFYRQTTLLGKTLSFMQVLRIELAYIHLDYFHFKFYVLRNYYIFRLNMIRLMSR